jgi:hypothetical protein
MCASSLLASTYGDANMMNTQQQHGESPHSSSRGGPSKQSCQATTILDHQHPVLVHHVEGAFWLRNIANKESKFYNCLHALPKATVWRLTHSRQTPTQSFAAACLLRIS